MEQVILLGPRLLNLDKIVKLPSSGLILDLFLYYMYTNICHRSETLKMYVVKCKTSLVVNKRAMAL